MFVASFFYVLNLCILGGFFVYVIKKHVASRVYQAYAASCAHKEQVRKRYEQLKKDEQALIRAYYHQNYRYDELSHKVKLWAVALEKRAEEQTKIRELNEQQHYDVVLRKHKLLHEQAICQKGYQAACARAEQELASWFSEPNNAIEYIDDIMSYHTQGKS